MKTIDKAIKTCDFRSGKNIYGDEVIKSCSSIIDRCMSIRNKAASESDENKLKSINDSLVKAYEIINKI